MKKKILGVDLGVASIGWALIEEDLSLTNIIGMGSRIIPLNIDDKDEFTKGNAISKNQKRTARRTQRKGYDRYQQRRTNLIKTLEKHNLLPNDNLRNLPTLSLWGLRANAVITKIKLEELGRVLLHLNQKRGYKSSRSDSNLDKKETDYVAQIKNRLQILHANNLTIGQYFYSELQNDATFRTKQIVYPREAYIEEFDSIIKQQKKHYPTILTEELIQELRNVIIFYQRRLKSQKGLVSTCEFEGLWVNGKKEDNKSKFYFVGPKVAPRSSPLFQIGKIWESINSISIKNKNRRELFISLENKNEIFIYLDNHEKLSEAELFKILKIQKSDGWIGNKMTAKGIQGNLTKFQIMKILGENSNLLKFNLFVLENRDKEVFVIDKKTGEILSDNYQKYIDPLIEKEPLYLLWHTIYSIPDLNECVATLVKNFDINETLAIELAGIDFTKYGFGNKSSKAIRKTLPYLMEGYFYSEAASFAGYNHSDSLTKDEILKKELLNFLPNLKKNSLRQPIVEKILNQLINVVNEVINEKRGWVSKYERQNNQFEIRIELARELKQSKEERNDSFKFIVDRDNQNKKIIQAIENLNLKVTRSRIQKYRMFFENTDSITSVNSTCVYCGKGFGLVDALSGNNVDVEHIIPKSKLFDDSQSNKTLSHRSCNESKGDRTAYDFMRGKGTEALDQFIERVNRIASKTKKAKLLASFDDYMDNKAIGKVKETEKQLWEGFIDRQLRETQYIAKKSIELLNQISLNVWATSGEVTAYLRNRWGWDDVTMNLQLQKYRELGMTSWKQWETNDGQLHKKEIINDWSKRDDHRHHAIDALVIACTKQGFIQRLNTLSSQLNREEMYAAVGKNNKGTDRVSLLDSYIVSLQPFTTNEVEKQVANILVSFKAGKKVTTIAKRKIKKGGKTIIAQEGILVPRGALSEESVYGKIKEIDKNRAMKHLFNYPNLIINENIKRKVIERLIEYKNDVKISLSSLKNKPIFLNEEVNIPLEFAHCFKEEIVIKYSVDGLKQADMEHVIDPKIRFILENRILNDNGKIKNSEENPIWFNEKKGIKIRTVRMRTGLNAVESIKTIDSANNIEFEKYVKPGNNHHVAIYKDDKGEYHEAICSFWDAVERKKYNLPIIVKSPVEAHNSVKENIPSIVLQKLPPPDWIFIESLQQNEMFLLGNKDYEESDNHALSFFLYTVWSLSKSDYWFRHHIETKNSELKNIEGAKESRRFYRFKSLKSFFNENPIKVIINNLGEIVSY